jgi:hypothetical protein
MFSRAAPRSRFTRREETAADTCCCGFYAAKVVAEGLRKIGVPAIIRALSFDLVPTE